MLGRLVIAVLLLGEGAAIAQPVEIRATCAAAVAGDPAQLRILREELARALREIGPPRRYTLDVSLVQIGAAPRGDTLEIHVELRAMLSDEHRRVLWSSSARATARGAAKDRSLLQRDALAAAADRIATHVRDHVDGEDRVASK